MSVRNGLQSTATLELALCQRSYFVRHCNRRSRCILSPPDSVSLRGHACCYHSGLLHRIWVSNSLGLLWQCLLPSLWCMYIRLSIQGGNGALCRWTRRSCISRGCECSRQRG